MKLSPRHEPTTRAGIEISQAVTSAVEKHGLTFAELMSILAQQIATWARMEVRSEREE